jgi:predicted metal-dependent phosphoesterase TrpH
MRVQAELHCHTTFSDGFASPEDCAKEAYQRGLRILAITDHNTAEGGLSYWDQPLVAGVLIIPGEEISTDRGHVLAYFVQETISPGHLDEVLDQIDVQGAVAYLAHPYHIPLGNRWRSRAIFQLEDRHVSRFAGIEVENGHNRSQANKMAASLAQRLQLNVISGSDAHMPMEIGNARTQVELSTFDYSGVRQAFISGRTKALSRRFNAYPIYLFTGILNKLTRRRYAWETSSI